jgi:hypothetical protein
LSGNHEMIYNEHENLEVNKSGTFAQNEYYNKTEEKDDINRTNDSNSKRKLIYKNIKDIGNNANYSNADTTKHNSKSNTFDDFRVDNKPISNNIMTEKTSQNKNKLDQSPTKPIEEEKKEIASNQSDDITMYSDDDYKERKFFDPIYKGSIQFGLREKNKYYVGEKKQVFDKSTHKMINKTKKHPISAADTTYCNMLGIPKPQTQFNFIVDNNIIDNEASIPTKMLQLINEIENSPSNIKLPINDILSNIQVLLPITNGNIQDPNNNKSLEVNDLKSIELPMKNNDSANNNSNCTEQNIKDSIHIETSNMVPKTSPISINDQILDKIIKKPEEDKQAGANDDFNDLDYENNTTNHNSNN